MSEVESISKRLEDRVVEEFNNRCDELFYEFVTAYRPARYYDLELEGVTEHLFIAEDANSKVVYKSLRTQVTVKTVDILEAFKKDIFESVGNSLKHKAVSDFMQKVEAMKGIIDDLEDQGE